MKLNFETDKKEVLRYAGHRSESVPENINRITDEILQLLPMYLSPKYIAGRFDIEITHWGVKINGTDILLPGQDIKNHLSGCSRCYIICATAGLTADGFIRTNMAIDTVHGILADAAATRAVESYCDAIENALRQQLKNENKFLTRRYSPGYGDFPFTRQPDILNLLQTEKFIGVSANDSCIMIPSKSVTAVMGIADKKPAGKGGKCQGCPNKDNCDFSCR